MALSTKIKHTRIGESLVEVILAIFVVGIGVGVATTLIVTALESNNFSRDNLIAMNLATEGIEAVRSIRDSNWLKYSFDREHCWNLMPTSPCTAPYQKILSNHYIPYLDANNVWQISASANGALDLESNNDAVNNLYQLKIVNLFGAGQNGTNFYVPQQVPCVAPCIPVPDDRENLRFYRMITTTNEPDDNNVQAIKVESLVEWKTQGIIHKILLTTRLTNYQQ